MSTGIVKWFDERKGQGSITVDGEYREIYCHESQLIDPAWLPKKNQRVTFVEDRGRDGRPYARRVVILEDGK